MTIATAASSGATPAAVEFALLESWLASGSALQLPLDEIECQQQAQRPRGAAPDPSRLTCSSAATEIWGPRCASNSKTANCSTLIAGPVPVLSSQSLEPSNSSVWVTPTPVCPVIFPLDRALSLAARSFSYELQRRLVRAAL
jgi:hypothetical protein